MHIIARTLASAAAAGTMLAAAGTIAAHADEPGPSVEQLLKDCKTTADYCTFTIASTRDVLGPSKQVSDAVYNCTPDKQSFEVNWSDTTTNKVNAGIEVGAEYGFTGVFKGSFKASLGYEWSNSKSFQEKYPVGLQAGWVGWVERAPSLTEVTGDYELHYGDRVAGHYYWFAKNVVFTGPSQNPRGNVIMQARPMTDQEKSKCVGSGSSSDLAKRSVPDDAVADPPAGGLVMLPDQMDSGSAVQSTPLGDQVQAPPAGDSTPQVKPAD